MKRLYVNCKQDTISFLFDYNKIKCDRCKKTIDFGDRVKVYRFFDRTTGKGSETVLCLKCEPTRADNKVIGDDLVEWDARFVNVVPSGCTLIMPIPNELAAGKMDTLTAAIKHDDGVKIIDNTKLAGRQSWEGAKIGLDIDKVKRVTFKRKK